MWVVGWSEGELVEGVEDLLGFGAGAVVGVDIDPAQHVLGVEDRHGRHRQRGGGVGVDRGQVQPELELRRAGLGEGAVRMPSWPAMVLPGSETTGR